MHRTIWFLSKLTRLILTSLTYFLVYRPGFVGTFFSSLLLKNINLKVSEYGTLLCVVDAGFQPTFPAEHIEATQTSLHTNGMICHLVH